MTSNSLLGWSLSLASPSYYPAPPAETPKKAITKAASSSHDASPDVSTRCDSSLSSDLPENVISVFYVPRTHSAT